MMISPDTMSILLIKIGYLKLNHANIKLTQISVDFMVRH